MMVVRDKSLGLLMGVAMLAVLSGCSTFPPNHVAERIGAAFYQYQIAGDRARALRFFSRDLRPGEWTAHFDNIDKKLGPITAIKHRRTSIHSPYRGRFYTLDYSATYANGTVSAETLTLFNTGDDKRVVIVRHEISADGV